MQETQDEILEEVVNSEYKYGFITDIETDDAPIGLTEETVRFISAKKEEPEWMLEWRLKAFRDWQKMTRTKLGKCAFSKSRFSKYHILFSTKAKSYA
jgi:Fe-S cluster assembly protein SufB